MDIRLGCKMIIEFSKQERMPCRFVGMSVDEFLLLKVPLSPGIRDRIVEGMMLQFRYLNDGNIISFKADVLRYQASPTSLVFISYPPTTQAHNLRREKRYQCNMPTTLSVGKRSASGRIVDINYSGCRFVGDENESLPIKAGKAVKGAYETLEGAKAYEFSGVVKLAEIDHSRQVLGIKFDSEIELPEKLNELLNQCCILPDEHPASSPGS